MSLNVANEVAALQRLSVKQLQARYAQAFGESTNVHNKTWLVKRIAWRLQALAEGDLSQRARERAARLANDADLRVLPPKMPRPAAHPKHSAGAALDKETVSMPVLARGRLPMPGTVISRIYKGQTFHVKVWPHGFEFGGQLYQSLSAVAKAITGQHCSGIAFFHLDKEVSQ